MAEYNLLVVTALSIAIIATMKNAFDRYLYNKTYKLPPQIPGVPILGNILQIPLAQQGQWGKNMAAKYGEMFTVKLGSNTWVFLNSSRVVTELLEKRSAIYSSRPYFPYVSTIMSDSSRIVVMPYNDRWRAVRKIMHSIMNKTNAAIFAPFQDLESKHLLYDYLHHPDRWFSSNQRFANSVIMSVTFGKRLALDDSNIRELFETSNEFLRALQPGASPVDTFHFLEYIPKPLQWWRSKGEYEHRKTIGIYRREVEALQEKIKNGTARDCFAAQFLAQPDAMKFGETQRLFSLGSIIEAGSDTSRMTISQIIAAAAMDKRWVKTARDALDQVCGSNAERLPEFSDRKALPYITAVVKEGFRWRPFAEIGVPHALTQDDEFEGCKFPAGTVFTWNALSIALDPKEYEEPMRFWPERFLNEDLNNVLKGQWAFGAGRRVCTGYNIGESNVWIVTARLLYCFDFEEIPGQSIDSLNINWLMHESAPFPVKISIRSPEHRNLVDRIGKIASETMY